jgi:hypothetical protein
MEPLTIFSLAVNIVQLIDFGARLLREARDIHHSSTGHTAEHVELAQISQSLTQMCDSLRTTDPDQQNSLGPMGLPFSNIALATKTVAQELIAAIEKLKVENRPVNKWRSFRQAMMTLWNKDQIENLRSRLESLRSQLQALVVMHVK